MKNDTRSSDLHREAELRNRNERNLELWRRRHLARVMSRVSRNMNALAKGDV